MYEAFYGLREKPFSLLPDPSFLYLGAPHSMAYAVLEYGVLNQAGFTVITGEVGSGKTVLVRHLLERVESQITVGLISNTAKLERDLLRWVLLAFNQDHRHRDPVTLHDIFEKFLISQYARGDRTVLIVDEAQNLSIDSLEELRMLSNINADKDLLLQVVLVGQPELKHKLECRELRQLAQRISASYHLGVLSEHETLSYIRHRLARAGAERPIFTDAACQSVYGYSKGVPRLINILSDTALVYGYAEGARDIGASVVSDVIRDFAAGIHRDRSPSSADPGKLQLPVRQEVSSRFSREMAREHFSTLRGKE
jgi:type II secretory pathway predicted ATPase ExeA